MSSCCDFIIANSTFSWWAAYLRNDPEKQVIAPIVDQWNESIYPEAWTALNANLQQDEK